MKTKKTIFLSLSLIIVVILVYLNVGLASKNSTFSYVPTQTNYNVEVKESPMLSVNKSYNSLDVTSVVVKNSPVINKTSDASDVSDMSSTPSDMSYSKMSSDNSSDNNSSIGHNSFGTYNYNSISHSNNSNNKESNNYDILISSYKSSKSNNESQGQFASNNYASTSLSTTASPEIDASNYSNGPSRCEPEPTKCGHNVWVEGYWIKNGNGVGHGEFEWIPGYWKWVDEPCPPPVAPVGNGTLILMSLLLIYIPFKLLLLKKIKI